MGNGCWPGQSSKKSAVEPIANRPGVRMGTIAAVCTLLLAASGLLGFGYRLQPHTKLVQSGAIPPLPFSQSFRSAKLGSAKLDPRMILPKLPLIFEPNQGQANPAVKFLAHGAGYALSLNAEGAVLAMQTPPASKGKAGQKIVRMEFIGSNANAEIAGMDLLPGKSNYLIGNDPQQWHRGVPQFAGIHYRNVYPGIDLVFYGNQGHLEYDFRVAPGADPSIAKLGFDSTSKLELSGGDLLVSGRNEAKPALRLKAPRIYQTKGDRREPVTGRFVLRAGHHVGFELGPYDRSRELVIDPALDFSSYFGSVSSGSLPAVAVNNDGSIYLAGSTTSGTSTFPLGATAPVTLTGSSSTNIFVTKIVPSSPPTVAYATFFGGSGTDTAVGLGVDLAGNTYVAGNTTSTNFPTSTLAYQTAPATKGSQCTSTTCTSLFVSAIATGGGSFNYSSYVSGNGNDVASGVAIDTEEDVFITGTTTSNNASSTTVAFPATLLPVPLQDAPNASIQFFVTKVNTRVPGVGSIAYSTYFGGSLPSSPIATGGGIVVDTNGNIYFSGTTNFYNSGSGIYGSSGSGDFPILNAYQPCLDTIPPATQPPATNPCSPPSTPYASDGFLAKINPEAQNTAQLLFSSYFGGTSTDTSTSITVDSGAANVYITGSTNSNDFLLPTNNIVAFQSCLNDPGVTEPSTADCPATTVPATNTDAYVARFTNPTTSTTSTPNFLALSYFSYMGGGGNEVANSITVDTASDALITGSTNSGTNTTAGINNPPNLPTTTGAIQTTLNGTQNAFFARINTTTTTTNNGVGSYITYFGGNGVDNGTSITIDTNLNTYFAGTTTSSNLQVDDSLQSSLSSPSPDAFVVKLGTQSDLCITCVAPVISPSGTVSAGNQVTITFDVANNGPDVATAINVLGQVPAGVSFDSGSVGSGTCSTPSGTSITCQIPTLQAGSTSIVTFVVTPNTAGTFYASATVSSANNTNTNTTSTASFVASAYTMTIAPSSVTVAAGSTAQYSVLVAPTQGVFAANVSLTCSTLPTGATCSFTNSTLTLSAGAGSASSILNLTTTAQPVNTAYRGRHGPLYALWLLVPAMAFLGLGSGRKRRRTRLFGFFALMLLFAMTVLLPACGGSKTQPTVSGTPSGTYPLTVTATSGSFTKTASFSLTVIP
jgi:hypothetical protein